LTILTIMATRRVRRESRRRSIWFVYWRYVGASRVQCGRLEPKPRTLVYGTADQGHTAWRRTSTRDVFGAKGNTLGKPRL
jgi:hypothetical protein